MEHAEPLLAAWRRHSRTGPRTGLTPPGLRALESLFLPRPAARVITIENLREQVHYTAARLAKLSVPLADVNAALAEFQPLAIAQLSLRLGERQAALVQNWAQRQTLAAVAEVYVASQSNAVQALLAVLDAELNSAGLGELLQRLLLQAAQLFPIRWGEILLIEPDGRLRHAATYGLDPSAIHEDAGAGSFFNRIVRRATPGFLLDAARDPRLAQPYFRALRVKSVWAVPLARRDRPGHPEVLGVLTVAFDRVYECLPQEKELLLALAERSTLAIERTQMTESLGRQQKRVLELSRRLLDAQDEERRRISRDLHDETGQALLALRLYLEMGLREASPAAARKWLEQGLALVDTSVAELRRILAQLSPLLLDELGLEAALRLELRRLRAEHQWRTRFQFNAGPERLERSLEILVYRVVLEGLRNIARHARAGHVQLRISALDHELHIRLMDDGVGMSPRPQRPSITVPTHFGLAGMRERVRLAGGRLEMDSARGRGLRIDIRIPTTAAAPAAAVHAS